MKIKYKIIISTVLSIIAILMSKNYSNASLADVRNLANKGSSAVGEQIQIAFGSDMATANNNIIYCISQGQHNAGSAMYKVLTYIEIENGIATSWDVNGIRGALSGQSDENKILAEILSGNYGLGYGLPNKAYTDAQRGLYLYLNTWINAVGKYIGTDESWYMENGYVDNGKGQEVINKAKAAVAAGANPSLKLYLLDNWNAADNWQRLAIAFPGSGTNTQLTILKIDSETAKPIPNVGFKIIRKPYVGKEDYGDAIDKNYEWYEYDAAGQKVYHFGGPGGGEAYIRLDKDGKITYTEDSRLATEFKTDEKGIIRINGLRPSTYSIEETTNPYEIYENAPDIGIYNVGTITDVKLDTNATATVTVMNDKNREEEEEEYKDGEGKVTISGIVWEAELDYKDNSYNDTFNFNNFSDEKGNRGVEGVKVYWKKNDGTLLEEGYATTDKNGFYSIEHKIPIPNHDYTQEKLIASKGYQEVNNSFIEFEYNGFKYTTVAFTDKANGSRAVEILNTRTALDNKFNSVKNGIVENGKFSITTANAQDGSTYYTADVGDKGLVKATTQNKLKELMSSKYAVSSKSGEKYCHEHCKESHYTTSCKYCIGHDNDSSCSCGKKYTKLDGKRGYKNCSGNHCLNKENSTYPDIDTWDIKNMNLGLVQREQPDVAITSDIAQVRVIMKGQQYTYIYGNRGIQNPKEGLFTYRMKFGKTYTRKVNPADIAYINEKNSNEMEVYVTYNIKVKNHSNTLPVSINQIANYYDSRYSISSGTGWNDGGGAGNGFNVAYYNVRISLQPNATSDIIPIEYKVNNDTIKNLLTGNQTLKNVSEITSYTTFYGTGTTCEEHQVGLRVGQQYAGVDRNSIPGNYNTGSDGPYEDDTSNAPSFELIKDPNYKIISGNVYEDTTRENITPGAERNGDGTNNSEPGVGHMRVELLKRDGSVATLYSAEGGRVGTAQAITYTDKDGNYAFGYNEGTKPTYYNNAQATTGNNSYSKIGVIADDYIIRFTYGDGTQTYIGNTDNKISARNYKSTIVTTDNNASIYGVMHNNDKNDKWHLTATNNRSIAIDDIAVRNSIDTSLKHSTFNDTKDISAYTMPFKVQLEYTQDQTFKVEENGNREGQGDFEHDWTIFDFGIAERAREDIVIDKTISNLKITLGNGQILMDGNPRTDKMNYLKYLGNDKNNNHPNRTRNEALTKQSKLAYIEMDTELIQGATLDIIYTITVTNNSEKDYDYKTDNGRYYYYADKSSSQEMPTTVELVADYMDPELTCYVGNEAPAGDNNQQWIKTTADELKSNGLISDEVNNRLKTGEYLVFKTEYFKDVKSNSSKSLNLHASKLLANSAEDYIYENHTEILQTNGQIARTIDKVDYKKNSNQVVKTYTPGNYIPSLSNRHTNIDGRLEQIGLHQQDDDAITIRITPPTGILNYYTRYIIASVIGLIVIVGGIIIIKKKVLDK